MGSSNIRNRSAKSYPEVKKKFETKKNNIISQDAWKISLRIGEFNNKRLHVVL